MVSKAVKKFYVYIHFHPESKEVVYVGKGTAGRAWQCGYSTAKAPDGLRGNRTKEHQQWIEKLLFVGYTPSDYVQIIAQGLDKKSAYRFEAELTEQHKIAGAKLFNRSCYGRTDILVLTPNTLKTAAQLRVDGLSYAKIAKQLEVSTMAVWRALNGKTKGLVRGASNGQ